MVINLHVDQGPPELAGRFSPVGILLRSRRPVFTQKLEVLKQRDVK